MIIWITGLSGAGKTTLAKALYIEIKKKYKNSLWFDGDTMRDFFDNSKKYDKKSRIKQYEKLINYAKFCDNQKINLVISALYFDNYIFKNNKKNFKNYYQIYLKSDLKDLIKRNNKKLYSKNLKKRKPNIVGWDIKWKMPKGSNLIINNFYSLNINKTKVEILKKIKKRVTFY